MLYLTNLNTVTCPTCQSELGVKNKKVNSAIGAVGGALGGTLEGLLAITLVLSGNIIYLGFMILSVLGVFFSAWLLEIKYLKLKLAESFNQPLEVGRISFRNRPT
jgi:hypothetical protein